MRITRISVVAVAVLLVTSLLQGRSQAQITGGGWTFTNGGGSYYSASDQSLDIGTSVTSYSTSEVSGRGTISETFQAQAGQTLSFQYAIQGVQDPWENEYFVPNSESFQGSLSGPTGNCWSTSYGLFQIPIYPNQAVSVSYVVPSSGSYTLTFSTSAAAYGYYIPGSDPPRLYPTTAYAEGDISQLQLTGGTTSGGGSPAMTLTGTAAFTNVLRNRSRSGQHHRGQLEHHHRHDQPLVGDGFGSGWIVQSESGYRRCPGRNHDDGVCLQLHRSGANGPQTLTLTGSNTDSATQPVASVGPLNVGFATASVSGSKGYTSSFGTAHPRSGGCR